MTADGLLSYLDAPGHDTVNVFAVLLAGSRDADTLSETLLTVAALHEAGFLTVEPAVSLRLTDAGRVLASSTRGGV